MLILLSICQNQSSSHGNVSFLPLLPHSFPFFVICIFIEAVLAFTFSWYNCKLQFSMKQRVRQ